jgi:alpha-1,2-mannosyltransferase
MSVLALLLSGVLSISRVMALYANYGASINTWMNVSHLPFSDPDRLGFDKANGTSFNVCLGKEWHRFPSSFFLPADNWEMK